METHSYADMAALEEHNWWYVARRELIRDLIARSCPDVKRVLDLGCGVGSNALALITPGSALIGVDMSEEALAFCRSRGVYTDLLLATSEHIPVADASIDLVVAADVLEHMDDERALAEIYRVLKPGGSLLATVPAHRWLWNWNDDYSHHKRRYANGELEKRLVANHFTVERSSAWNLCMVLPVFAVSLMQRLRAKPKKFENNLHGIPSWLNGILLTLMRWENAIVLRASLPLGVSIVVLSKKA